MGIHFWPSTVKKTHTFKILGQSGRKQDQPYSAEARNHEKCMLKGISGDNPIQPATQSSDNLKVGSGCTRLHQVKFWKFPRTEFLKPLRAMFLGVVIAQHMPTEIFLAAICSHCLFLIPCTYLKRSPPSVPSTLDNGVQQEEDLFSLGWTSSVPSTSPCIWCSPAPGHPPGQKKRNVSLKLSVTTLLCKCAGIHCCQRSTLTHVQLLAHQDLQHFP